MPVAVLTDHFVDILIRWVRMEVRPPPGGASSITRPRADHTAETYSLTWGRESPDRRDISLRFPAASRWSLAKYAAKSRSTASSRSRLKTANEPRAETRSDRARA